MTDLAIVINSLLMFHKEHPIEWIIRSIAKVKICDLHPKNNSQESWKAAEADCEVQMKRIMIRQTPKLINDARSSFSRKGTVPAFLV